MFAIASMQITKYGWDENGLGLVLESVFKLDAPQRGGRNDDVQTNSFKFVYGNARGGRACLSAVDSRARSIRCASGSDQRCIRSAGFWSFCENEKCRAAFHLHGDQPGARPLLSEQAPFRKIGRARPWRQL